MWAKWGGGGRWQNLVVWGGTHKEQEGQSSLGGQGAKPRKLHEARWPPGGSTIQLATHRMGLLNSKSQLCGACSQGHTGAFLRISPRYSCTYLPTGGLTPSHDEKCGLRNKVPPRPQLQPGQV